MPTIRQLNNFRDYEHAHVTYTTLLKPHEEKTHAIQTAIFNNKKEFELDTEQLRKFSFLTRSIAQWHHGCGIKHSVANILLSLFSFLEPHVNRCETILTHQDHLKVSIQEEEASITYENAQFSQQVHEAGLDKLHVPFLGTNLEILKVICGGEKAWEQLPVLDLNECGYVKERLSSQIAMQKNPPKKFLENLKLTLTSLVGYVHTSDMTSSVMRGKDSSGNDFLAFIHPSPAPGELKVQYVFQHRIADSPVLVHRASHTSLTQLTRSDGELLSSAHFVSKIIREITQIAQSTDTSLHGTGSESAAEIQHPLTEQEVTEQEVIERRKQIQTLEKSLADDMEYLAKLDKKISESDTNSISGALTLFTDMLFGDLGINQEQLLAHASSLSLSIREKQVELRAKQDSLQRL